MSTWEEIKKQLEPCMDRYFVSIETDIQLSIAISLKRIADKLELSQKQPIMMTAQEFAEYKKSYDTHPGLGVKV